jgi:hypothetical protein
MRLTKEQSSALFEKHGCYVKEVCDKCGTAIHYANRFTIREQAGVWCSRECRDGMKVHEPGTCRHCNARLPEGKRRGAVFCDDACKQAAHRSKTDARTAETPKLSVTNTSIYAGFCTVPKPPSGDIAEACGELQSLRSEFLLDQ